MAAWMIRAGRGGTYAQAWLDEGCIAIFWDLGGADITKLDLEGTKAAFQAAHPDASNGRVASCSGQVHHFAHDMGEGTTVVMYDPSSRLYHIGRVTGPCTFVTGDEGDDAYTRPVEWLRTAPRDALPKEVRNHLGSIATIFTIRDTDLGVIEGAAAGSITSPASGPDADAPDAADAEITFDDGIERIKDQVMGLEWDEMELLVAGLLRALGYKTSMTRKGSDGGRDIIASPDGLGFGQPRIVAEVKHRQDAADARMLRSFIGGLRDSDSGLYVSTGGFTKDALYEADRAKMPFRALDLDTFVRLLVDVYDQTDADTKALLPLRKVYLPAGE